MRNGQSFLNLRVSHWTLRDLINIAVIKFFDGSMGSTKHSTRDALNYSDYLIGKYTTMDQPTLQMEALSTVLLDVA